MYKFSLGGFCPGGFWQGGCLSRGFLSGGFCPGGFCPGGFVLIPNMDDIALLLYFGYIVIRKLGNCSFTSLFMHIS